MGGPQQKHPTSSTDSGPPEHPQRYTQHRAPCKHSSQCHTTPAQTVSQGIQLALNSSYPRGKTPPKWSQTTQRRTKRYFFPNCCAMRNSKPTSPGIGHSTQKRAGVEATQLVFVSEHGKTQAISIAHKLRPAGFTSILQAIKQQTRVELIFCRQIGHHRQQQPSLPGTVITASLSLRD